MKIDILLLSGNHFMEQNFVQIPIYTTYITNYLDGRAHAGSAIISRRGMKHHNVA
jgi:hypothetical protein